MAEVSSQEVDFVVEDKHAHFIALIAKNIQSTRDSWQLIMNVLLRNYNNPHVKSRISDLLGKNKVYRAVLLTIVEWVSNESSNAKFSVLLDTVGLTECRLLRDRLNNARNTIQYLRDGDAGNQNVAVTREMPTHNNSIPGSRLSEMDPTKIINGSTWVVSLARNSEGNSQHVFIILEGVDGERAKTYFMDFVAESILDLALPGIRPGRIRFYPREGSLTSSLLYSCPLQLLQLVKGQQTSYSCNVERSLCEKLVEKVNGAASTGAVMPQYNIFGGQSVLARFSALSLSNQVGHSCLSWAYDQLEQLNDPGVNEILRQAKDDYLRYIIAIPSRALPT